MTQSIFLENENYTFNVENTDMFLLIGTTISNTQFTIVPSDGSVYVYSDSATSDNYTNLDESYTESDFVGLEQKDMVFDGNPEEKSGIGTSLQYSEDNNSKISSGKDPKTWSSVGSVVNGSKVPIELSKMPSYKSKINLNNTIVNEYIPIIKNIKNYSVGTKLLAILMTQQEGFSSTTSSYKTNNPGNIGNTDTGNRKYMKSLEDGIKLQLDYITQVAIGKHTSYPLGKKINIKPYYSPEIARYPSYALTPYLPGYIFTYTGKIDEYVKIYSTGARVSNAYNNMIVSWFRQNGYNWVTEETTIKQLVDINNKLAFLA